MTHVGGVLARVSASVTSDFGQPEPDLFNAERTRLQEGYGAARTNLRMRAKVM